METIDLTTPYVVDPRQATTLSVDFVLFDWKGKRIEIHVGDGVIQKRVEYTGEIALTLMVALNKANLSTKSLHKRIIERLVTDGYLAGTISGSPD